MGQGFDPTNATSPHNPAYVNGLSLGLRKGKYMIYDLPHANPSIITTASTVPAFPTASQGQTDTITLTGAPFQNTVEMFQTTAQTLMPAVQAAKGLEIGLDEVDNESVEYVLGGLRASNPLGYTAGTDPGVFIKATVEFTDRSGTDQFIVGFRKNEAFAVPTSFLTTGDAGYVDFAGIGFSGITSDLVKTMTDIGNTGSTTVTNTAFAFADAGVHTLETRIKGRAVSYYINGALLGSLISKNGVGTAITAQQTLSGAAYSFTSALFLVPFIFHRYDTNTPGTVFLRRLECGQLLEVGLQNENRGVQASS